MSRQKLILPAFIRSMKDQFTPCRLSALRAVLSCQKYFSQRDVAEKVLPCVVPHTLDAANDVREEAFKVVDALLAGLREESRSMAKDTTEPVSAATFGLSQEGTSGGTTAPAPASGGYLSGLSTWMTTATAPSAGDGEAGRAAGQEPTAAASNGLTEKASAAPKFSSLSLSDAQIGGGSFNQGGGGWSDDDGEDLVPSSPTQGAGGDDGWDDDDFGEPGRPTGAASGNNDDDFFGSFDAKPAKPGGKLGSLSAKNSRLTMPKKLGTPASMTTRAAPQMKSSSTSGLKIQKQPKPAVKKLPAEDLMDGWDDF